MAYPALEIHQDDDGILWLSGELDLAQADTFPESAAAQLNGAADVVLDCSQLTFLDSSGIRAIFQLASKAGRPVVIRNPTEIVRRVFDVAGIDGQMGVRIQTSR
jgi:stage II sporulation protein AA (anti-sigma F factor antagonist)